MVQAEACTGVSVGWMKKAAELTARWSAWSDGRIRTVFRHKRVALLNGNAIPYSWDCLSRTSESVFRAGITSRSSAPLCYNKPGNTLSADKGIYESVVTVRR